MYKRNINIIIQLQHWNKSHREKKNNTKKLQSSYKSLRSSQNTERVAFNICFSSYYTFFFFCSSLIRCATPIHFYKYVWVSAGCPWDTERVAALANFLSMLGATQSVTPSEICLLHFNFIFSFLTTGPGTSQKSQHLYFILFDTYKQSFDRKFDWTENITFASSIAHIIITCFGWFSWHNRFFSHMSDMDMFFCSFSYRKHNRGITLIGVG